jgi:hypothetical protein
MKDLKAEDVAFIDISNRQIKSLTTTYLVSNICQKTEFSPEVRVSVKLVINFENR